MKTKTIPFLILAGAVLAGCAEKKVESVDTRPLVRTGGATNGVAFVDTLRVQGQIRAKRSVKVSARIPGSVDVLLAEEGATVKKGTPLFRADQVNVGNAVRAAKDDLAMAKAKLAQAEATDAKAKLDCERMARLLKDGAVTKDMAEKAASDKIKKIEEAYQKWLEEKAASDSNLKDIAAASKPEAATSMSMDME